MPRHSSRRDALRSILAAGALRLPRGRRFHCRGGGQGAATSTSTFSRCRGRRPIARPPTTPTTGNAAAERRGFVVHGFWPQHDRGYPEYCSSSAPRRLRASTLAASRRPHPLAGACPIRMGEARPLLGALAGRLFRADAARLGEGCGASRVCGTRAGPDGGAGGARGGVRRGKPRPLQRRHGRHLQSRRARLGPHLPGQDSRFPEPARRSTPRPAVPRER